MAHKWQLGVEWYKRELRIKNAAKKGLVGEKTPELIYVEDSLPRIKQVCPVSYWCTGVLVYWCTGVLVYWCTGVLVYWCTGVLVYWCTRILE